MTAPQSKTIANELGEEITLLMQLPGNHPDKDVALNSLEFRGKQLAKASPANGYIVLAAVSALRRDYGTMRSRFRIAQNNHVSSQQAMNYVLTLNYCGFYSEAGGVVQAYWETCADLSLCAERALSSMHYQLALTIYQRMLAVGMEFNDMQEHRLSTISSICGAMTLANISDSDVTALADIAGSVMRKHNVGETDIAQMYTYPTDDDGVSMCKTIFVPVSHDEASDMTMELAEAFAQTTLPFSINNFIIRFSAKDEHHA